MPALTLPSTSSAASFTGSLVTVVLLATALPTDVVAQPAPLVPEALAGIEATAGGPVDATISPTTGLISFLTTEPGLRVPSGLPLAASATDHALAFLDSHGAAFGLRGRHDLTVQRVSEVDEVGMEHVRFRQTFKGVPVTAGELTVHLDGGYVVTVNAHTLVVPGGVELVPALDAAGALAAAKQWLAEAHGIEDATLSVPRLELFNRGLLESRSHFTRLAWFVEARRIDLRRFLWIDAHAGRPLLDFSQLTEARDRKIYDANDPGDGVYGSLPGTLVRTEGGSPVVGPAAVDANAAYDFSGDTYDYFFDEHGRDSYDGAGAQLISTVRFCPSAADCPHPNAFWNGIQMVYGAGFPVADDVDAHELTHAVTEHTAGLFYYMQSGALNESYSDIFGETVDLLNGAGTDSGAVRWLMGEDVPGFGAIRDMEDPTAFGDPGKMSDGEFACGDSYQADGGGVHSNSGVPNHAFALMVDGGSYNGEIVTGIGLTKAGKIQYRALAHYLLSASDFLDNHNALEQSCQDLIGTSGITAVDCGEVVDALDAVEMDHPWPCTPAQAAAPSLCPAGQAPSIFTFVGFEDTPIAACPSAGVASTWCTNGPTSLLGTFATSGVRSGWGYNRPTAASQTLFHVVGTLPTNTRLQFNHSYGFENTGTSYWDGGVVEYSTNGGASWSDAGGLITAGQAYGGTISSCCSNPLGGRSAFVRESWGYTATQLDLSAHAGTNFGYRFNLGTDFILDDYGWFVDDIRIYSCATCATHRVLDEAYTGTASRYRATSSVTAGDGFTVGPAEDVRFEAGNRVVLEDGFKVAEGGTFTVDITPCP